MIVGLGVVLPPGSAMLRAGSLAPHRRDQAGYPATAPDGPRGVPARSGCVGGYACGSSIRCFLFHTFEPGVFAVQGGVRSSFAVGRILIPVPERGCVEDIGSTLINAGRLHLLETPVFSNLLRLVGGRHSRAPRNCYRGWCRDPAFAIHCPKNGLSFRLSFRNFVPHFTNATQSTDYITCPL